MKRTLAMKLAEVMACVDRVAKNGNNTAQNYKYAMAADVYDAVRAELSKRFVIPIPTVLKSEFTEAPTKAGGVMRFCSLLVRYDFMDGESGEVISAVIVGMGSDSGDKHSNKALTGATKACLINTFLIPTGDDPENEKNTEPPAPSKPLGEKLKETPRAATPPPASTGGPMAEVFPNYGMAKGQPIRGATEANLNYYRNGAMRSLADPAKARFHAQEQALLNAIGAELERLSKT